LCAKGWKNPAKGAGEFCQWMQEFTDFEPLKRVDNQRIPLVPRLRAPGDSQDLFGVTFGWAVIQPEWRK
jgi:hypothetical protein